MIKQYPTYVIYHASCADGFTAAWAVHVFMKSMNKPQPYFLAWQYQKGIGFPEPIDGHDVLIVDFSFPREQLEEIHRRAESLFVIDHHKTAQKDLADLDYCLFDMSQSGAMLTWKTLFGEDFPRPQLIDYIQDRDLWTWELPNSKEVSAAIAATSYDFDTWSEMAGKDLSDLVIEGAAILRYQDKLVQSAIKNAEDWHFEGAYIKVAKSPFLQSEIGHKLIEDNEFAVTMFEVNDDYVFSMRSADTKPDVSEIARRHGGGGHRNAAGFSSKQRETKFFHPRRLCSLYGCE